ncbi:MAG: UbiD family decarboxylase [Desulfuromonadales bacterium]|nr:UbiD family decarboxylase [Desulfuromonadales bacterium]
MTLRALISALENDHKLRRIAAPVSPDLELAAITDRVCKAADGGPALLFERVDGCLFPVVTNLFGTAERTARALGESSLASFGKRLRASLKQVAGRNAAERLHSLLAADTLQPVVTDRPPCREVSARPDLSIIPALKFWPQETLPSLTLPLVFTADPVTGRQNCGMYRIQIHGSACATVNFGEQSGGGRHLQAWREKNQPMPVAIALGGDPALIWAAGAPLPEECDELRMAAWVSGRTQPVTRGVSQPLQVPADTEIVIEGVIHPGETAAEGLFGNHTGGYVTNPAAPLFRVTAISHRTAPVCPVTLVGPPPMEDCFLARASEQLLLALLRSDHPQVRDLHMPLETIFHGCALLAVSGLEEGEGVELLRGLRSTSPLRKARLLVLLDRDIDIRNPSLSYWRVINQLEESRILTDQGRISIDATGIDPARLVEHHRETLELISRRWSEYGLE